METISAGYFVFVYAVLALPFIAGALGIMFLIAIAVLYATHRREIALKLLKIFGVLAVILIALIFLTKSSLGI